MPELRPARIRLPDAADAYSWETTDGHVLYGVQKSDAHYLWSPGLAVFRFARDGAVEYDSHGDVGSTIRFWERSALPLALEARGIPVLHASAVIGGSGVVALCGRSTAGKSTLCASLRVQAVADDALGFVVGDALVDVLTLPFELRLRPSAAEHLGLPLVAGQSAGRERLPFAHLVLLEPDETSHDVTLTTVLPSEAFGALMPHAYCFSFTEREARIVEPYAALVERVPAYRLQYPHEHRSIPGMVDAVRALLG